jgi:hypothetical protein
MSNVEFDLEVDFDWKNASHPRMNIYDTETKCEREEIKQKTLNDAALPRIK